MPPRSPITLPPRSDPAVARILRSWRRLTDRRPDSTLGPGSATLVACSGGADSSALVLALASAGARIALAHVVHDMRPEDESLGDRDAVRALADGLSVPFHEAHVREARGLSGVSNAEADARARRYQLLASLARRESLGYVATGHHADDQFETVLMSLLRGAGPHGLRGVHPRRALDEGSPRVVLVRPMLDVRRSDAERICRESGYSWCVDRTNEDRARLRSLLREQVVPMLERIRPGASVRVSRSAESIRRAVEVLDRVVDGAWDKEVDVSAGCVTISRGCLRNCEHAVAAGLLRRALVHATGGVGVDRFGSLTMDRVLQAARDTSNEPRVFDVRNARILVGAGSIRVESCGKERP